MDKDIILPNRYLRNCKVCHFSLVDWFKNNEEIRTYIESLGGGTCEDATYEVLDQDGISYGTGSIESGTFAPILINVVKPTGIRFKRLNETNRIIYNANDIGTRLQGTFFNYLNVPTPAKVVDLDYTSVDFFFRLDSNVSFNGVSNNFRFVDYDGNQAFPATDNKDKVFIDKLTGLAYVRGANSGNMADSYTNIAAFSVTINSINYNQWFMASLEEGTSLYFREGTNGTLDLIDPNTAVINSGALLLNRIRTSNKVPNLVTTNYAIDITAGGVVSIANVGESGNRTYLMVSNQFINLFD